MRKVCMAVAALIVWIAFYGTALAADTVYEDPDTGVRFTIPKGWHEEEPDPGNELFRYMITREEGNDYHQISFGSQDMWQFLSESERTLLERSDIDNSLYNPSDIKEWMGAEQVSVVSYNGIDYFKVFYPDITMSMGSVSLTMQVVQSIYIQDANQYVFMYIWTKGTESRYSDLEALLNSVEYPNAIPGTPTIAPARASASPTRAPSSTHTYSPPSYSDSDPDISAGGILLSLIVTIAVYSLPIIVYRYGIRKRPMEPKPARRLMLIWMIVGFFMMCFIVSALNGNGATSGGGMFLWSYVNYRMLIGGTKGDKEESPRPEETDDAYAQTVCDAYGRQRYRGHIRNGLFHGTGTLYTVHGETVYAGWFTKGFIDETEYARALRLNAFKESCAPCTAQEVLQEAQVNRPAHVRVIGKVLRYQWNQPYLCSFVLKDESGTVSATYHMSRGESQLMAGRTVAVWGSVEGMMPDIRGAMLPHIEARCMEDRSADDGSVV